MRKSNYDKHPAVRVPDSEGRCVAGWEKCIATLNQALARTDSPKKVLVVECYPGVDETRLTSFLEGKLSPTLTLCVNDAFLTTEAIERLVEPYLGGHDPVFGFLSPIHLPEFFDNDQLELMRGQLMKVTAGLVLIIGCGARQIADGDVFVYADLSRWEAQNRFRRKESGNLGAQNRTTTASLQYKRAFFVDWRVADRWKRPLIEKWDYVLDTHDFQEPKLAEGEAVRRGLRHAVTRPFRVVPFFDPAPWGGQWMKEVCDLPREAVNYGWCFDCVPEENSLLLDFGGVRLEIPAINLVFYQPRTLLGGPVYARFGDEFPIRFDFLDTMGGGNLSLQVHPLSTYIKEHFGMPYTQDESYYLLEAGKNACVYLGLHDDVNRTNMVQALEAAQTKGIPFPAEEYANKFPARKHDHFLIPAGTVHCSGNDSMVLEISATPYIFTFKLWDWARLGLDGKPRPIHLQHGTANIQWDRNKQWVQQNLINQFEVVAAGDGWREERTGLHELEFIETRRHWFTKPVTHDTNGTLNVLNLVEGEAAIVESPSKAFEPFTVHYAETFIVPAAVGPYTIRPLNPEKPSATMKAYVRQTVSPAHD